MGLFYFTLLASLTTSLLCLGFKHLHLDINSVELGRLISNAPKFHSDPISTKVVGGIEGLIDDVGGGTHNDYYENIVKEVKSVLIANNYNVKAINNDLLRLQSPHSSSIIPPVTKNWSKAKPFLPSRKLNTPLEVLFNLLQLGIPVQSNQTANLPNLDFLNPLISAGVVHRIPPSPSSPNSHTTYFSTCMITPISLHSHLPPNNENQPPPEDLYFLTDFPAPYWSSYKLPGPSSNELIMYIGPDTCCLLKSLPLILPFSSTPSSYNVLDICTGCGVQGITLSRLLNYRNATVKSVKYVDVNERARKVVRFNSILNSVSVGDVVISDVTDGDVRNRLIEDNGIPTILTSNPPFVPSQEHEAQPMYTSNSKRGDCVFNVTMDLINRDSRVVRGGIVTEVINPSRVMEGWDVGVAYCNDRVMTREEYCGVREGGGGYERCVRNLKSQGVEGIAVGLVLFDKGRKDGGRTVMVEKGKDGGMWTLWNGMTKVKEDWRNGECCHHQE